MEREKPSLPFRLVFLGKHMAHLLEHRFSTRGLNRTQTIILRILGRRPGLQAQDLCVPAGVDAANVSRTLQSLERLGLVDRRPHPTDGRASIFSLTEAGQATAEAISQEMRVLFDALLDGVDPQDLRIAERVLDTLWQNVRDQFAEAGVQPPLRPPHWRATPGFPEPPTDAHPNGTRGNGGFEMEPKSHQSHQRAERRIQGGDRPS